jgi:hypothetical protein
MKRSSVLDGDQDSAITVSAIEYYLPREVWKLSWATIFTVSPLQLWNK